MIPASLIPPRSCLLLAMVFLLSLCTVTEAQTIRYVDQDAVGANNGTSWNDAFVDLEDALLVGQYLDQILIAEGTYTPGSGSLSRSVSFGASSGTKYRTLRGGYAGVGAPDPDLRDYDLHTTVLSGDLLGDDGPNFSNRGDNCYHVVTNPGTLDGLTIRGGNADGLGNDEDQGGGLYKNYADPTDLMFDCTFTDNQASRQGGGAYVTGSLDVNRCAFIGNKIGGPFYSGGSSGAGLYHLGDPGGGGQQVTDCTFADNIGETDGTFGLGGVGACVLANVKVSDCVFQDNVGLTTTYGAGLYMYPEGLTTATDCFFEGNSSLAAGSKGGGLYVFQQSDEFARASGCEFVGNSVPLGEGGGAFFGHSGIDYNNTTVLSCSFVGNLAQKGGGLSSQGVLAQIGVRKCSFSGNTASDVGGAVYLPAGGRVSSSILWSNVATAASSLEEAQIALGPFSTVKPYYSCIEGLSGSLGGTGNISSDPLFVDQDGPDNILGNNDDDLNLSPGSPCIDSGEPSPVYSDPDGSIADMGSLPTFFEFWVDLGFALGGASGEAQLVATGPLTPASPLTFDLANANPFWLYTLVLGVGPIFSPFKLGTFVPHPDCVFLVNTDPWGSSSFTMTWPSSAPSGFTFYAQYWTMDPLGPVGWSSSNAVMGTVR